MANLIFYSLELLILFLGEMPNAWISPKIWNTLCFPYISETILFDYKML